MAFSGVATGDYVVEEGEALLRTVASSDVGRRTFCGACGTPLHVHVAHQPDTLDFSIATLDEPNLVAPGFHIFYGSRIAWAGAGDDLPRHARLRSDTRGLARGQTSLPNNGVTPARPPASP